MANNDGKIVLSTHLDTSGIIQDIKNIRSRVAKLADEYDKAGLSSSEAFKKARDEVAKLEKQTKQTVSQTKKLGEIAQEAGKSFENAFSELQRIAAKLAVIFSVAKLISFSTEAADLATQAEASAQRIFNIYGDASDRVDEFIDANARALGMSKTAAQSYASVYGNLFSSWADGTANADLTNEYLQMTAVVASNTGRTVEDVQERIRSGLLGNTEAIEDLGIFVNVSTIEMTNAFKRMSDGKSWEQLDEYTKQQIRAMAILEQATSKYGDEVLATTATAKTQFKAAYEEFKATWGELINAVLIPSLNALTQILDVATQGLKALISAGDKTSNTTKKQENSTSNIADNIDEQVQGVKMLNKELNKTTANFDDIQILESKASAASADTGENTQVSSPPDGSGDGKSGSGDGTNETKSKIQEIMEMVGGAMIAIGIILLATGSVGLGIGFIAAGALIEGIAAKEDDGGKSMQDVINRITQAVFIAGMIAIVLGILLCATGNLPLGIKLISIGAVSMFATLSLNPKAIGKMITDLFADHKELMALIGAGMVIIGIILLMCPAVSMGIGIGAIVAGIGILVADIALNWGAIMQSIKDMFVDSPAFICAMGGLLVIIGILAIVGAQVVLGISAIVLGAGMIIAEVAINWDAISQKIVDICKDYGALVAGIGALLIIIGILACVAQQWILGISAIVGGAAAIVSVIAINWDAISQKVSEIFNKILTWIKTYGFLVLGILLCISGVGIPFGIAMIVSWAKSNADKVNLANEILNLVKKIWNSIKHFWNNNIVVGFKKAINWVIDKVEGGINGIISLFENMVNFIVDGINKFVGGLDTVVSFVGNIFGANWSVGQIPHVNLKRVSLPRLARGAVIPPNSEFLAVLGDQKRGTNIEAPLDTIVEAVMLALSQNNYGKTNGDTTVVLELDGRELGRAVVEQGNRENRRIGTRLVVV